MIKNGYSIDILLKTNDIAYTQTTSCKLGCVVRIVVDSLLPHAECGPNDHRKDAPPFSLRHVRPMDSSIDLYSFSTTKLLLKI